MLPVIILTIIVLAGGILLAALKHTLSNRNGSLARRLFGIAGVLLFVHGVACIAAPVRGTAWVAWADFNCGILLLMAKGCIPRAIGLARMLALIGGTGMMLVNTWFFALWLKSGFPFSIQGMPFTFIAECTLSVLGAITAATSFHLRFLDTDPYAIL
jgi:hypothetical protein